jgi:ABC transport system ATP-binding/permease protein
VAATCIAAANSLREIVKELPIYRRDRAAGMSIGAYLGSKFLVIGTLTIPQVLLLVAIGTARASGSPDAIAAIFFALALAAMGAVALGLLISSLVGSSEKAMALIAVIFVGEWLFSGAAVDLQNKPPLQAIGYLTSANWGMAAAASGTDLYRLEQRCIPGVAPIQGAPGGAPSCDARWRHGAASLTFDILALVALISVSAAATRAVLRRQDLSRRAPPSR